MRQAGFTLVEVLVAFVIAAFAVAALVQGGATGLQSTRVAAHSQEAVSRAQSRLASLSAALQPGEQSGDDGGGYLWRTRVQAGASVPAPQAAAPGPNQAAGGAGGQGAARAPAEAAAERVVLYAVTVAISWQMDGGTRQVALSTQRLGLSAPERP
ncbi:MAG: prepilin-type N-terminal cleavage/methylation domain-containing protein [Janthinobacterium lividum]